MPNRMYEWEQVTAHAPFAPRDGAGSLVFQDRMWLLGGWSPQDSVYFPRICNNEVWSSVDGLSWDLVKPNSFIDDSFDASLDWEGRHTAGYVVHDDLMWIAGGDVNQGYYQNDVWSSTDGKDWTLRVDPVPWGPRALHHTVAFRDHIWVIGGQTVPQLAMASTRFCHDIWRSADGVDWEQVVQERAVSPVRGMIGCSAVHLGRMWILGGGTYDTPDIPERQFYNDVWSSPDGISWDCHTESAPWTPRQYHEIAVFDGRLWVLEGYNSDGNRNDVWCSEDGVDWTEIPGTPWPERHAASVFVYQDALWMVAGNNMTSDVWKLVRA